jgi:hypothetical protein
MSRFGIMIIVGVNLDEVRIGDVVVEITHNGFYACAPGLDEDTRWSRGLGINLRVIEVISLYFIPCI